MNYPKKTKLGFFPTPLHKLENLSKKYPDYQLFIKRDDQSGIASGGNKVRKLEFLLEEAIRLQCDTVITAGAQQSNHCRQTAAACAMKGIDCHLLLGGEKPDKLEGNLLISCLSGAHIHFEREKRKGEGLEELKKSLESNGHKPYLIPYGGSNITGAFGFIHAIKELKDQLASKHLKMHYVFFASSSGGMQSGLTLGKSLYHLSTELMPVCIDNSKTRGMDLEDMVHDIVKDGNELLELDMQKQNRFKVIHGYDEAGYGVVTDNEKFAIKTMAAQEGIILDPVYTGRAFYGLLDFLDKKLIPEGSNILFWHTGGFPAIFAGNAFNQSE